MSEAFCKIACFKSASTILMTGTSSAIFLSAVSSKSPSSPSATGRREIVSFWIMSPNSALRLFWYCLKANFTDSRLVSRGNIFDPTFFLTKSMTFKSSVLSIATSSPLSLLLNAITLCLRAIGSGIMDKTEKSIDLPCKSTKGMPSTYASMRRRSSDVILPISTRTSPTEDPLRKDSPSATSMSDIETRPESAIKSFNFFSSMYIKNLRVQFRHVLNIYYTKNIVNLIRFHATDVNKFRFPWLPYPNARGKLKLAPARRLETYRHSIPVITDSRAGSCTGQRVSGGRQDGRGHNAYGRIIRNSTGTKICPGTCIHIHRRPCQLHFLPANNPNRAVGAVNLKPHGCGQIIYRQVKRFAGRQSWRRACVALYRYRVSSR